MRQMGPLAAEHPLARDAKECPGCNQPFRAGDLVTLIVVGPGDNEEARTRRDAGRPYNAVALPVHWDCSEQSEG